MQPSVLHPTSGLCCLSCVCAAGSAGACGPCPTRSGAGGGLGAVPEPHCSEAGLWQGDRQLGTLGDSQHTSPNPRHPWLAQVLGGSAGPPSLGGPCEGTGDRAKLPRVQAVCPWYRLHPSTTGPGPIPCRLYPPTRDRTKLPLVTGRTLPPASAGHVPPRAGCAPVTGPGPPCDRPETPNAGRVPR